MQTSQPDGRLVQLPFEAYQAEPGINQSGLKSVLASPAHYRHRQLNPEPDRPELFVGRMTHLCVLEPQVYEAKVELADMPKTGERRKAMLAEAAQSGRTLVTAEEDKDFKQMRDAVWKNSEARRLLSKGRAEESLWWQESEYRVRCKARFDFLSQAHGKPVCVDLKTARAGDYDSFSRELVNSRYDLQAFHYTRAGQQTELFEHESFYFIVVEKKPPFACVVYQCGPTVWTSGFVAWEAAMLDYSHAYHTGKWPGPQELSVIEVPKWAQRKQEEQGE